MTSVDVNSNQKGAIGEALIFHGRTVPFPISEAIESFVEQEYSVADNTPIRISREHGTYLKVSTGDGETISTRVDGGFTAKWVPEDLSNEVVRTPDGHVQNLRKITDESAFFPTEVKTGKYAELERDQKEILETVATAITRDHPIVVRVLVDKLPDEYDVSVRVL